MKITIDATPQEFAELIFELVDCDVKVVYGDDADDEDEDEPIVVDITDLYTKKEYKNFLTRLRKLIAEQKKQTT